MNKEPGTRNQERSSPSWKLATASQLYWSARDLKARTLHRQHPEWSESRIKQEVRNRFMFSRGLNR